MNKIEPTGRRALTHIMKNVLGYSDDEISILHKNHIKSTGQLRRYGHSKNLEDLKIALGNATLLMEIKFLIFYIFVCNVIDEHLLDLTEEEYNEMNFSELEKQFYNSNSDSVQVEGDTIDYPEENNVDSREENCFENRDDNADSQENVVDSRDNIELFDVDDMIDSQVIPYGCHQEIILQGAGIDAVNGTYTFRNSFDHVGMYEKQGVWENKEVIFSLFRTEDDKKDKWWYISIIPEDCDPGTNMDIDFYYSFALNHVGENPPKAWNVGDKGLDPAPECVIENENDQAEIADAEKCGYVIHELLNQTPTFLDQ